MGAKKGNKNNYKHGGISTKLYKVWSSMKNRCLNINHQAFNNYGGRGITICPEWANDYTIFRDWSLSNGYQEGLEIDRRENNGNYSPENCRFVTAQENSQNRRNTKLTLKIANEIRELWKTGKYLQKELAEIYNTDKQRISRIVLNKIWKN